MHGALHITNGDSVELRETGLGGEVLTWRDMLHEGPVPAGLTLDELRPVRARFLADLSGTAELEVLADLERRDRTLARFAEFEEVVLWFEHDLYDQLQLIQIVDWLARQERGGVNLSLICTGTYLGMSRPAELRALYPTRRAVAVEQFALASRAWEAFSSADPKALVELIREDTSALPYLHGALLRHLEQFPSVRNGLSRTERQILEIVEGGASRAGDLFRADQACEERVFMGDLAFFSHVRRLAAGRRPLLEITGALSAVGTSALAITPAGTAVLHGAADAVNLNGIDRWLGGVRLHGGKVWRWNGENQTLVPPL
ncbi:MAG TPA: DUF1835 domain-containing protein [Terriglobia bacterium]|nr:DUF1835 domain-containing protein [Terriglobia bacterium]